MLAALVAVAAVYLATRLALLGRMPPFYDELGYGEMARRVAENPNDRFIALFEGKEPLVTWLGALLVKAGVPYLTAVRLVSFTAGALAMTMIGLVGRRFSSWVAVVAMALYATLPLFVVHDSMGLMEPTVTAASMTVLYLAIRLARTPRLDLGMLLGFALGAGVLTKASGRFAVVMLPLSLVLHPWRTRGSRALLARWAGAVVAACLIGLLCFAVLTLSPLWPRYLHGGGGLYRPLSVALGDPYRYASAIFPTLRHELLAYVGLPLAVIALGGLVYEARRDWRLPSLVAAWGIVPFAGALVIANAAYPRYWLNAVAPLLVLAAVGLVALVSWAAKAAAGRRMVARLLAAAAVALGLAIPLKLTVAVVAHPRTARYPGYDDGQFVTDWPAGTAWPAVAAALRRRPGAGPVVVASDRFRALSWLLRDEPRFRVVLSGSPEARDAAILVRNLPGPLTTAELGDFRLVARFPRPRGGVAIRLLERRRR